VEVAVTAFAPLLGLLEEVPDHRTRVVVTHDQRLLRIAGRVHSLG
jgi:hypothetical protein